MADSNKGHISRRDLIKSSSVTGILTTFGHPVTGKSSNSTVEVPVAKQAGKTVATRAVSRDWWDHVLESRKARDEISERVSNTPGVIDVQTSAGEEQLAGHRKRRIQVNVEKGFVNSTGALKSTLPETQRGVPVSVRQTQRGKTNCINHHSFNPVPGGSTV